MTCIKSCVALLVLLLSAAPAAGFRSVQHESEESEGALQASAGTEFQGYCMSVPRGTYKQCSQIEGGVVEEICKWYTSGKQSPTLFLRGLKAEKCLKCSAKELETKCKAAMQPLVAPSIDQCVSLHRGFPKDAEQCERWEEWLRFSAKRPEKKFEKQPGINVKGCYKTENNFGGTLCKKYALFCTEDSRTEADKAKCTAWESAFEMVEEDRSEKPMWKDPYQVGRSRLTSVATTDADLCLQAFHETLTKAVTDGGEDDKGWKWFKSKACQSMDDFVDGTKWVRRHFAENAKVKDKAVCSKKANLINVHCRSYAGFCTAAEGSDLFTLPPASWTGKIGGDECSTTTWE